MRKVGWAAVLGAVSLALVVTPTGPAAADPLTVPSRVSALKAGQRAIDHFYANNGGATADAGWRWAPFFMAVDELHRQTGEARYGQWLTSWGDRNAWTGDAPASATSNPDSRAAIQVFHDVAARGLPADMAPSDRLMAQGSSPGDRVVPSFRALTTALRAAMGERGVNRWSAHHGARALMISVWTSGTPCARPASIRSTGATLRIIARLRVTDAAVDAR